MTSRTAFLTERRVLWMDVAAIPPAVTTAKYGS